MLRHITSITALALTTSVALAAGSDSTSPPKPTQTTTDCLRGQVWDTRTKACVDSQSSLIDDDTRYEALRELSYAESYEAALVVLSTMAPQDDRALTYRGFIARKQGDWGSALTYYDAALARNPDNLLARSYLGQGHVTRGENDAAQRQLDEIRKRGGQGTWAELSLAQALQTGRTSGY